jgi:PAS domain S-box-containing protein
MGTAASDPSFDLLLVGDSSDDAELLERTLHRAGLRVRATRVDDVRALRQALAEAHWDLVVCHSGPARLSREALDIVSAHDGTLPFILVSGAASGREMLAPLVERSLREAAARRAHLADQHKLAQLAAIVESSQDAIVSKDLNGIVTSWNRGAQRLYGWSAAEVIGRPLDFMLPEGHEAEEARILEQVAAGMSIPAYDTCRLAKDGGTRDVSLMVSPIYSGDEVVAVSSIARDISEQREVEAALGRSEDRYRMLLEHLPDAIVVFFDRELRIEYAAGRLLDSTGWSPAELVGRRVGDLLPPPEASALEDSFRKALEGMPAGVEIKGVRNPSLVLSYDVVPVHDEHGTIVGGMMLGRDVGSQRRSEGELRTARELFEGAFENAPVGMAIVAAQGSEEEGRFIRVNRAMTEITGIPEAELVGMTPSEITHPEDREETDAGLEQMLRGDVGHHTARKRYLRPDGGIRWVVVRARLVHDSDGKPRHALGVLADVSSQVEAQEESQRLEAMLNQSQKLEGIGRLAGGIAHDFNNLLAVILNYADLARREELLDESLTEISRAARRAADLTSRLLVFSRQEVAQPVVLDLNLLVEETQNFLRRTIGEDVRLSLDLHSGELPVRADKAQLEQTLMNLAVNARDAMPRGGRLRIETRSIDVSKREAPTIAVSPGRYTEIRVADTGTGMAQDVLERVFEPFYTTKEKGRGTGLGLAMVYGIATRAGGTVLIESKPGEGTTVRVLLPQVDAPISPETHEGEAPIPEARGQRVLVAEDEDAVRRLIQRILSEHGYEVLVAGDGDEALQILEASGPVDTLLTDVVMPAMTGTALADRVTARWPDTRLVFTTGYTDRPAQIPPGAGLLLKPFRADELLRAIGDALASGNSRS